jgi:methyl-accepting chemotaxis protein
MRLSVRTKLFGSFAVVVGLMVVLGAVALVELGSVASRATYLGTNSLPSVVTIGRIGGDVANFRRYQNRMVWATPADRAKLLPGMGPYATSATRAFASYAALAGGQDRKLWQKTFASWKAYVKETAGFPAAVKAGDTKAMEAMLSNSLDEFDGMETDFTAWNALNVKEAHRSLADARSTHSSAQAIVIGLLAVATLVAAGLAFVISRSVTGGVRMMLRAADGIAAGDLEQDVQTTSRDEIGETATAFGRMIEYLQGLAHAAERIAAGDLTVEVAPQSERDVLGNSFHTMRNSLRTIVGDVSQAATRLSAASQEMSKTSEETGRAVEEIARAVQDVATGAERQVQMVHSTRESANESSIAAERAREAADQGVSAAEQATSAMASVKSSSTDVVEAINHLAAQSEQIGGIVETITGIAGQTNLLALNAAIEAARAGEQGRGFAVVAEEVRKLAEESQRAAEQISTLVAEIQGETGRAVTVVEEGAHHTADGVAVVEEAREAFARITTAVEDVTGRVERIAGSIQEIAQSAGQVQTEISEVASIAEESSAATEQVSASTQETSASTHEVAGAAERLAHTAQELERFVSTFKLT